MLSWGLGTFLIEVDYICIYLVRESIGRWGSLKATFVIYESRQKVTNSYQNWSKGLGLPSLYLPLLPIHTCTQCELFCFVLFCVFDYVFFSFREFLFIWYFSVKDRDLPNTNLNPHTHKTFHHSGWLILDILMFMAYANRSILSIKSKCISCPPGKFQFLHLQFFQVYCFLISYIWKAISLVSNLII